MILQQCALCGEMRHCTRKQIDRKEYDVCAECWKAFMSKLKGKGRPKARRETVIVPAASPADPPEPQPPFPGKPPDIIAGSNRIN